MRKPDVFLYAFFPNVPARDFDRIIFEDRITFEDTRHDNQCVPKTGRLAPTKCT
jgi:hypothetical protein